MEGFPVEVADARFSLDKGEKSLYIHSVGEAKPSWVRLLHFFNPNLEIIPVDD